MALEAVLLTGAGGSFGLAINLLGTAAWQLAYVNDNQVAMGRITFAVQ